MAERSQWSVACGLDDLPEGGRLAVSIEGQPVLLLRQRGHVYALRNRCPHLGCALSRGALDGDWIACPCHDWRFDIRTGAFEYAREIRLPVFDAVIGDGAILVKV